VTQAHEAARRARDDAHRAADQLRIFFEDDGAVKASKIDLGKAQIVFSDDKGELKLANVDGRKLLTVKDPQGKIAFQWSSRNQGRPRQNAGRCARTLRPIAAK
jgi:hypothetical protein